MDEKIDQLPCGFLTLSKDGIIRSINKTLGRSVGYHLDQLIGQPIQSILTNASRAFFQLYFMPIILEKHQVEEMYWSLATQSGEELPVLINATLSESNEITCVIIPIKKRNQYETQLLLAKKETEKANKKKNKAIAELKVVLNDLEDQQDQLIHVNKQNQYYKIDTTRELQLAKKVQERAVTDPISNKQIDIRAYYKASSELSGDIYGFYKINKHQYGIILLDVMGHGISSALITMSLQSLFQRLISAGTQAEFVIQELDKHLHHLFQNDEEAWHYCTAIYLLIDTHRKTIEYINAGHPPAIYQEPDGVQKELFSNSPPLGSFEGSNFRKKTFVYSPGGRVLLYTDGVSEPLQLNRLNTLLAESSTVSVQRLEETIKQTLEIEGEDHCENDDQCFILVEFK